MPATYEVRVRPRHERESLIAQLQNEPLEIRTNYDVFPNQDPALLKVIRLPIDVPVYRMENGRTQTAQLSYIAKHNLDENFFSSGEENEDAQQAQHAILAQLAEAGRESSITPIIDELRQRGQTEPILMTASGQVVNGNRRLAAMRELFIAERSSDSRFSTVKCEVLPTLTPEQIDDLEIRLQMAPETKLPYTWINEALKIRRQLNYGKDEATIARNMRKRPKTVTRLVAALDLADIYLTEWCSSPRNYSLVEPGQQFFNDLVGALESKDGQLRDLTMKLAWLIYEGRDGIRGRIYDLNTIVGAKAETVLTRLAETVETFEDPVVASEASYHSDDDILIDFDNGDDTDTAARWTRLDQVFSTASHNSDRKKELLQEVQSVANSVLEQHAEEEQGQKALTQIRDALTLILQIDLSTANPDTFEAIAKRGERIIREVNRILDSIPSYSRVD